MKVAVRWATTKECDAIPDENVIPYSNAAVVMCNGITAIYWVGLSCKDPGLPDDSAWLMDYDKSKFKMTAEILDCIAKLAQKTWGLPFTVRFMRSEIGLSMDLRKRGFLLSLATHDHEAWEFTKPLSSTR